MRLLFLGDIVGRTGRDSVIKNLPNLICRMSLDFVIVNGENAVNGFGITEKVFEEIVDAGADVVTTGNHVWDQRSALIFAERQHRFLRPANFPVGTPGRGSYCYKARNGANIMVINVMGRLFMNPQLDDPFKCIEKKLDSVKLGNTGVDAIFVDFHAEATSEKQCFAHFIDGKVSAVVGTHTHVPTSDYQILDGGTAYISDAGMCGDYNSSLGMDKEEPINRFVSKISKSRLEPSTGPATICGIGIEIDQKTGLATHIAPLRVGSRLRETLPW